jgi:peptide deformylase
MPDQVTLAIERHKLAWAEYCRLVELNGKPDELERFHSSVVASAREKCRQLAARTVGEEKRLIEQLAQCHEECVAESYELRNPSQLRVAEEYKKLTDGCLHWPNRY